MTNKLSRELKILLNNLHRAGVLSKDELAALDSQVSRLAHGVATRNMKKVSKAINHIAKIVNNG